MKLDVNSKKIVAGKEVEKTNKMLQQLARILLKRKQKSSKNIPCPEVCPETKNPDFMDKPNKGSDDTTRIQQLIKAIEKLGNGTGFVTEFRQITERFNEDVLNMEKEYRNWVKLSNELDSKLM